MHLFFQRLGVACTGTLLLACADVSHQTAPAAPPLASTLAAASEVRANEAYLRGRAAHLARRFDDAIGAYQAALESQPRHVNARNGLATLYAEQGRFGQAIALWQALTAEDAGTAGPQSAFLFSNLGYARFLNGDYEQALGALEKACVLDPLNYRAWQHLGSALDKLGQHERARLMQRQAATLQQHDFKADYAVVARSQVAAIDTAVQAPERAGQQWAETQIHHRADGMMELRRVEGDAGGADVAPPRQAVAASAAAASEAPGATVIHGGGALVEIRNGNGVTGMARALAGEMTGAERVVRLTNQKGFGVQRTRVEYQPEFRDAAERLAARFGAARVVAVGHVGRADVRLVIGHDLVGRKPLAQTQAPTQAPRPTRTHALAASAVAPAADPTRAATPVHL